MKTKICSKCKKEKEICNFRFRSDNQKYRNVCKECEKEYKHNNYIRNKTRILEKNKVYVNENKEKVNEYKKQWEIDNPEKVKEARKKYREKNVEIIREKARAKRKKRYEENREKEINSVKKYYQANKEKIRVAKNKYNKNRFEKDELYLFKAKMRSFIWKSLNRKNVVKKDKTIDILGCSYDFLEKHLKKTFFNNYGENYSSNVKVHIDHIKPLATANTEEEVIKLCHYSNLQLLKEEDNLRKGDKLNWELKKID